MNDNNDQTSSSRDELTQIGPSQDEPMQKKRIPYSAPVLITWGTLRDVTQSVGSSGRNDGGRGRQRRTRW